MSAAAKFNWVICERCSGHGRVDNPAFSNGITSSEWDEWGEEDRQSYLGGAYDVRCAECDGSGKVQQPIIANLTFAEKRELVEQRRAARWRAESRREQERESRMLGEF